MAADAIVNRDLKEYEVSGGQIAIAQVETVGAGLDGRHDELMDGDGAGRASGRATGSTR